MPYKKKKSPQQMIQDIYQQLYEQEIEYLKKRVHKLENENDSLRKRLKTYGEYQCQ
jgi:exonuclease VII small subunit